MKKLFVVWFMLAATGIFPTITFRRDTVLPAQRYGHWNFTTGEILRSGSQNSPLQQTVNNPVFSAEETAITLAIADADAKFSRWEDTY
jgi:hypothetical protein